MRRFEDRVSTFSRVGAFWYEGVDGPTKALARHLSHAASVSGVDRTIERARNGLLHGGCVFRTHLDLPWRPDQVTALGADMQARIVETWSGSEAGVSYFVVRRPETDTLPGDAEVSLSLPAGADPDFILSVPGCQYLLFPVVGGTPDAISPEDLELKWLVPVPTNSYPAVIAVGDRYLTAGVDFQVQRGALVFREDPFPLFQDQECLHCLAAWVDESYLLDYPLAADHGGVAAQGVVTFLREGQSALTLRNALADIAGRVVLSTAATVSTAQQWCDRWIYELSDGQRLEIDYAHDPYLPGTYLPAGTLFGGGIRVEGGRPGNEMWHRVFNWSRGIPMGEISPFSGLTIPDHPLRFEAGPANGDTFRVRAWLSGEPDTLARYWSWIDSCEDATGRYLNDALGLSAEGETVYHNGVDFFFQHGLGEKALVVELNRAHLGGQAYQRCVDFAKKEKLHNTVLIILTT